MGDGTKIEWSDATLNVVTGCTRVSPGCDHCYIERTPPFRKDGRRFGHPGVGASTGLTFHPDRLALPLRWSRPRRIFVNSLSDLFHEHVPDGLIAALWFVMGQSAGLIPERRRGHTFQILTKRPARMRAWLRKWSDTGDPAIPPMDPAASRCGRAELIEQAAEYMGGPTMYDWVDGPRYWPNALPGVWLGVSAEDQRWADSRIPILLECPAVVRFVSAEPLLGPVNLRLLDEVDGCTCGGYGPPYYIHEPGCGLEPGPAFGRLHWVIAGGESGPKARPAHPDWFRSLRDQCQRAGVAFHFKQWGEWSPAKPLGWYGEQPSRRRPARTFLPDGTDYRPTEPDMLLDPRMQTVYRVGKKVTGRELDGRTWDEYPTEALGAPR